MDIQKTFKFAAPVSTQHDKKVSRDSKSTPDTSSSDAKTSTTDVYSGTAFNAADRARGRRKYGWNPEHFTNNGEPLGGASERELRNVSRFWRA